jgi:predicted kinase
MITPPKLIHLNGTPGAGKTTMARRYVAEHPLALIVSTDDIISYLGEWLDNESEAWELAFSLAKSMIQTHLATGRDVIVPHLLMYPEEADDMERIARECGATYFEFALLTDKEESIRRMYDRGTWGEPGSPALAKSDKPIIEGLYDKVHLTLPKRPLMVQIASARGDIDGTYQQLMNVINPVSQ